MKNNLKDLWIVGAGGFGWEILSWVKQHPDNNKKWIIKGFIDDPLVNKDLSENPIVKYLENYQLISFDQLTSKDINNALFILAIGDPSLKEKIVLQMKKKEVEFLTFIHPSVIIGENIILGEGVVVCPNAIITCDSKIDDFVTINIHSAIGHDCQIGKYTTISGNCDITGNCTVGKYVYFGTHANLIPGTIVEDSAVIGAGTVGIKKVKANTTIIGRKLVVPNFLEKWYFYKILRFSLEFLS